MDEKTLDMPQPLLARLERIGADTFWAHRTSGVRGALLKRAEKIETCRPVQRAQLHRLTEFGFYILEKSALERYK